MTSQKVPFYVVKLMINIEIFENVSALRWRGKWVEINSWILRSASE